MQLSSAQHAAIRQRNAPKPGASRPSSRLRASSPASRPAPGIDVDFENGLSGSWNRWTSGVIHRRPARGLRPPFAFDPESRTFKGTLPSQTGEWHYRAFYPHNGTASVSGSKITVTVPFSALRTQEGNRYNNRIRPAGGRCDPVPERRPGHDAPGRSLGFNLNRFTTILALRIRKAALASEKGGFGYATAEKPIASEQRPSNSDERIRHRRGQPHAGRRARRPPAAPCRSTRSASPSPTKDGTAPSAADLSRRSSTCCRQELQGTGLHRLHRQGQHREA